MLLDVDGVLSAEMALQNEATKGKSGRQIPLNKELRASQSELLEQRRQLSRFQPSEHVIRTERADRASPQAIVNVFAAWYLIWAYWAAHRTAAGERSSPTLPRRSRWSAALF
ncbi:hypothetical protein GTF94_12430 [Roseobacter sp. HKCCD5914]|uniref:hypothetical protein n=1 Tax=unclassified Roseobacter TaxID=196798 RepID=UPI0014908ADE|nr:MULTISPECIES: hypothetical protein [unclassified Roseobacter]NNV30227.1 hypothetical protein [Roseobacter sp. HKCCD9061]NNX21355.1 hypothetical protein [Roseobacter sp. HKCCD8626]NNX30419.1 hypothetical protein [Roseobacter sp. HKCCD6503]NNX49201.1 hypothetical protein [Roseobacter sp. HKCCD8429]NNX51250.1 hypothetical protein [Roseobacter sp. HKCCD9024]NNY45263.1 hypothetical protein [Roseobacter sp. HKCCD8801]NNZ82013.1 hypothetical protein [Roseobacter sp. HKCCD7538]NNZ90331.1 hypothe